MTLDELTTFVTRIYVKVYFLPIPIVTYQKIKLKYQNQIFDHFYNSQIHPTNQEIHIYALFSSLECLGEREISFQVFLSSDYRELASQVDVFFHRAVT